MRYLSVCSGIEAATVAWHPLGWEPAAFSEIDRFPRAVLRHHYPDVPLHGDFTTIEGDEYGAVDLLVGGTPCQSFSVAGLRKGLADERGNLALEYLRLAARLDARWLVWENVPGVLSSNGGRDFGAFLGGLEELGYGWAYRVLDAQFFGVPQRRRRVFVVGHLGDWRRAAAVLFERESLSGHPAPSREAWEGSAAGPARSVALRGREEGGVAGVIKGAAIGRKPSAGPQYGDAIADGSCYTLTTNEVHAVAHTLRADGFDAGEDGTGRGTPLVPVSVALRGRDGGATAELGDDKAFALRASQGGGDKAYVLHAPACSPALKARDYKGPSSDGDGDGDGAPLIAHTLRADGFDAGAVAWTVTQDSCPVAMQEQSPALKIGTGLEMGQPPSVARPGMAVRRITPREAERLQGFPDDYTRIPLREYRRRRITKTRPADRWERTEGGWMLYAADGPRYKALGNSMAVPVMRWLGERIALVEAL